MNLESLPRWQTFILILEFIFESDKKINKDQKTDAPDSYVMLLFN